MLAIFQLFLPLLSNLSNEEDPVAILSCGHWPEEERTEISCSYSSVTFSSR
jgi:hypothetical protein